MSSKRLKRPRRELGVSERNYAESDEEDLEEEDAAVLRRRSARKVQYSLPTAEDEENGSSEDEGLLDVDDYFSIRPSAQGKKPVQEADDEDDEEDDGGFAQDIVTAGNSVMRLIFFQCMNKKKCTSKDIKTLALMTDAEDRRLTSTKKFQKIMQYAQEGLNDLLGYQLVNSLDVRSIEPIAESGDAVQKAQHKKRKLNPEKGRKKMTIAHGDVTWYLRPKAPTKNVMSVEEAESRGVLMTMLGIILLERGRIAEDNLRDSFKKLGMKKDEFEVHSKKLVAQQYIRRVKSLEVTDDKASWNFTIGDRANVEIGVSNILRFLEQTCGQTFSRRTKLQLTNLGRSKRQNSAAQATKAGK